MRLTGGKEFALLRPGPVVNHAFAVILSLAPGYLRPTRTGLLVSTPSRWPNLRRKGAQSLNAVIGLWLGYSGIFANPSGQYKQCLTGAAITVVGWCSTRWVTGATHRLISGLFVVEDHGAQALKGVDEPVQLCRF